ncbi:MAG: hypothetical protein PHH84_00470 [Oscillospiraceae bacterium]|nr:hypothetical protein [Oscillospiraceae bacterium]
MESAPTGRAEWNLSLQNGQIWNLSLQDGQNGICPYRTVGRIGR